MLKFFQNLNLVNWSNSEVLIYHIRRIEESKLLLEEDYNTLQLIKSQYKDNKFSKPHWLLVACCSASVGFAAYKTVDSMWPFVISLSPAVYGVHRQLIMSNQKYRIDELLNRFCSVQANVFAMLEHLCNNSILDSAGASKLFRHSDFTENIELVMKNLKNIIFYINDNILAVDNMDNLMLIHKGNSENCKITFNELKHLNSIYVKIISKLLSTIDLCIFSKLQNVKSKRNENLNESNIQINCLLFEIIPNLLKLVQKYALDICNSYRNLHCIPYGNHLITLYKPLEWYLSNLEKLCKTSTAMQDTNGNASACFLKEISHDLKEARNFVSSHFRNSVGCPKNENQSSINLLNHRELQIAKDSKISSLYKEQMCPRKTYRGKLNIPYILNLCNEQNQQSKPNSNIRESQSEMCYPNYCSRIETGRSCSSLSEHKEKRHKYRRYPKSTLSLSGNSLSTIIENSPFIADKFSIEAYDTSDSMIPNFKKDDSNDSFESISSDEENKSKFLDKIATGDHCDLSNEDEEFKTAANLLCDQQGDIAPQRNFIRYGFMLAARTLARFRNEEYLYYKE